jgi:tRNA-2-methylthio-N6-dimethylallyladenosine synthase
MNEYDSDKMADVMRAAEGYEPTQDPEEADLILFNTCSVREKAQEKVFSDLGRVKHLKERGVLIGVGGCVASQEGRGDHQARALCGRGVRPADPAPPARAARARQQQDRPQVDISFPEIEKFDHLPPARVEGASAFRLHHGRLQQILQLLRGALHARRRGQPPVRRRAGRSGRAWPTRA